VESILANSLPHGFEVSSVQEVIIPDQRSSWNEFDEHGLTTSIVRLPEEKNWSFRRRTRDAWSHQANSSYLGILFGLTRELNLSLFDALMVNPKINPDGTLKAPDPYIEFDGIYLNLYSDYQNNLFDYQIDRFEPGGNFEYLSGLVNTINQTTFFEASVQPSAAGTTRSMCIYNQSNRGKIDVEAIESSTKFRLKNRFLCNGTVFFSNREVFETEVDSESAVTRYGTYWIDYINGIIRVFTNPPVGTSVRYGYTIYPFIAKASPIILCDIGDSNFQPKVFQQVLQDDGDYTNGLPTRLGVDIVNELLTVKGGLYWGR
jgi:hypothetical protein